LLFDIISRENGVSSIFGPITILFNYFNESKIELTPFSLNLAVSRTVPEPITLFAGFEDNL
jgi:hypothetical protein